MARTVHCKKLDKDLEGLEKPPFRGELGQQIFEQISKTAWEQWKDMQIKIINEYRLNMGNPKDYEVLIQQMMAFLNLQDGPVVQVEDPNRGRGA